MGFLGNILSAFLGSNDSEDIDFEDIEEESEDTFCGVPLSELNELVYGVYVTKESDYRLLCHYKSRSGKTKFEATLEVDEDGKLVNKLDMRYFGQSSTMADFFVEKANERYTFE